MDLVLCSIATNGYADIYGKLIASHRAYCGRFGYRYLLIDKAPPRGINGAESAWLKAPLLHHLLKQGSHTVFIDADAWIMPCAPRAETVFEQNPGADLLIAEDRRDKPHVNTGVMFVAPTPETIRFFHRLTYLSDVHHRLLPFHHQEHLSLYEQGHLRWLLQWHRGFKLLDPRWNVTEEVLGEGYIWHSGAPGVWAAKPKPKPRTKKQLIAGLLNRGIRSLRLKQAMRYYQANHLLDPQACPAEAVSSIENPLP